VALQAVIDGHDVLAPPCGARVVPGLLDLQRKAGIKTVYDLSATPYYLKGS
jgi:hypothetical protein